jgi:5-methyltetrahydropteroyltriglutamate--homocysteine methyltransferase
VHKRGLGGRGDGPYAAGGSGIEIVRPPRAETAEEVADQILEAARYISTERLGTTDDCGFAPFGDDTSTARETAFAKIRSRVQRTERASRQLGV